MPTQRGRLSPRRGDSAETEIDMQTNRLQLICGSSQILKAAIESNMKLASALNVQVPSNWTSFGTKVFHYVLEKIERNNAEPEWWTYFPILKREQILVGCCGYKGSPDENGIVEIGYEVAPDLRNRGFATEIANALIQHAFYDEKVESIIAHTLAETNASTRVLEKCGMIKVSELSDKLEGQIWRWKIAKPMS